MAESHQRWCGIWLHTCFPNVQTFPGGSFPIGVLLVSPGAPLRGTKTKQKTKTKRHCRTLGPAALGLLAGRGLAKFKVGGSFFSFLRRTTPVVAFQKADQKGKADETLQESNSNKDALTRVAPFGVPSTSGNHGYSLWRFRENSALVHSPFGVV